MRIELVISRTKQLPEGAGPALEKELITRLQNQYENCNLTIRRGSQEGLRVSSVLLMAIKTYTEHSAGNVGKR